MSRVISPQAVEASFAVPLVRSEANRSAVGAELIGDIPSLISKTNFVIILTKEGVSPFL